MRLRMSHWEDSVKKDENSVEDFYPLEEEGDYESKGYREVFSQLTVKPISESSDPSENARLNDSIEGGSWKITFSKRPKNVL